MRYDLLSPLVDIRAEILWAVVVGIQNDQNPALVFTLGSGQQQLPAEFILFVQKPVPPDPDRRECRHGSGRDALGGEASQQDRQRSDFSIALHD
ncbi:hypothetical protein ASF44_03085 [Pseudorhodoferax sp. Leaf274]|nr:hypothetical protein ASF44_03085 [Pseudorhodoferax sp. Leaf274]